MGGHAIAERFIFLAGADCAAESKRREYVYKELNIDKIILDSDNFNGMFGRVGAGYGAMGVVLRGSGLERVEDDGRFSGSGVVCGTHGNIARVLFQVQREN
jgi:hypothetical protein